MYISQKVLFQKSSPSRGVVFERIATKLLWILCSDLLTVTGNQMILNYDLMYRQESVWKTTKKQVWNYDVYDQNSLFYRLMTG